MKITSGHPLGAPAYLSVSGYELCLEVFTPNGASHTELCLPQTRADSCVEESWNQLKKVFEGDCPQKGCGEFCPFIYEPVCGSDGKKYSNECLLDIEKCKNNPNLSIVPTGECLSINRERRSRVKECAFNGKTYQHGASFKDDCNTCNCNDGQITCTLALCESPIITVTPAKPQDGVGRY